MRKLALALISGALLLPAAALADQCDYLNVRTNAFSQGPCKIERTSKGYRVTFADLSKPITIGRGKSQGQFHRWSINGKPATFYELDRGSFCGTTDDVNENICFSNMR